MSITSRLVRKTRTGFTLPQSVSPSGITFQSNAANVPMVYWPNGRWCLEANFFLLSLFESNLSTRGRGGSLLVYASQIGTLLRFCFNSNISLIELTDNGFSLFMRSLRVPPTKGKKRSDRTVLGIGRTCLRFLEFTGGINGRSDHVGPNGTIRAWKVRTQQRIGSSGPKNQTIEIESWCHNSFPTASSENTGMPIAQVTIDRLKAAIPSISSSSFLLRRRQVMLLLLEISGGRRSEVALLTTRSVTEALKMKQPMLRLATVKQGGNQTSERLLPVARADLKFVHDFIEKSRRRIVRKTCKPENDDGYVLVSERTGRRLSFDYIGLEVWKIRKAAGIEEKAHAHMFRHRFITKLFVQMVKLHEFTSPDAFRKALLNVTALKQRMLQWTGHKKIYSLDRYIDLAFDELSGFKDTQETLQKNREKVSVRQQLDQITTDVELGEDRGEIVKRLRSLSGIMLENE